MDNLKFIVFDKTENRQKRIVSIEWNMDEPDEIIEIHTYPIAIYRGGYRFKPGYRHVQELDMSVEKLKHCGKCNDKFISK